jgi:hypothetical protein
MPVDPLVPSGVVVDETSLVVALRRMIVPGGDMKATVAHEAKAITAGGTTTVDHRRRMPTAEKDLPPKNDVVPERVVAPVTVIPRETTAEAPSLIGGHAVGAAVHHPGVYLVDVVRRPLRKVAGAVAVDALDGGEVAVVATIETSP